MLGRSGRRSGVRGARRWVAVAAVIAAGYLAGSWIVVRLAAQPVSMRLPLTPRAWLDAYEAAAVDTPGRVCSELFSPELAQAYARAKHASCRSYFREITSFSARVRRVLELRQTVRPRDWAVVLTRQRAGWQAVDLVSGQLVH